MPETTIEVYTEGATEENIINQLKDKNICPYKLESKVINKGEDEMMRLFGKRIKDYYKIMQGDDAILKILIMRDLDTDNGKTIGGLCDSVQNHIKHFKPTASLTNLSPYDNIFTLTTSEPSLYLALHIATKKSEPIFTKSTIDDYILEMASEDSMATSLIEANWKSDWSITPEKLIYQVNQEVPNLTKTNGVTLKEAKDYIRFYAASLRSKASPQVFARQVLSHAAEPRVRVSFEPLIAALNWLENS